jgi:hypothetical protein
LGTVSKNFFKKVVRHMNNKRKMKKKKVVRGWEVDSISTHRIVMKNK